MVFIFLGLEILARLCQVVNNWDLLSENLEQRVYDDIVNMLTVHDIQLIVFTLEALYHLSELGDAPSNHIAKVHASIGEYAYMKWCFQRNKSGHQSKQYRYLL